MTYISAFRCLGGVVMSADTQEDLGDQKNYVEKLTIVEGHAYPLAIGGAGIADLIDPMVQEVTERAAEIKPTTAKELATLIREAIVTVYRDDLPWLAVKKHERTPEFLIAAKPTAEDCCIFWIKGRRLYSVLDKAIIGYATPVNYALLKRMYRDNLPMQQAVMLAIYLVSLSKKLDTGVGGETRVAVVKDNGAWIDDPESIAGAEKRIEGFMKLTDQLFLACADTGISPQRFEETLARFGEESVHLHRRQLEDEVRRLLKAGLNTLNSPYPPIPPGTVIFLKEPPDAFLKSQADAQFEVDFLTKDHPVQFEVDARRVMADILRAQHGSTSEPLRDNSDSQSSTPSIPQTSEDQ